MAGTKFINKLPYFPRKEICDILDNGKWRDLAGILDFSHLQIQTLARAFQRAPGMNSPTDDLLTEWGYSNPTISTLYKNLKRIKCIPAANVIEQYINSEEEKNKRKKSQSSSREHSVGSSRSARLSHSSSSESDSDIDVAGSLPGPTFGNNSFGGRQNNVNFYHQISPVGPPTSQWKMPNPRVQTYDRSQTYNSVQQNVPIQLLKPQTFHDLNAMSALNHTHKYHYDEIKNATYGFDEELLLGKGGFGEVYKGVLANTSFAIKRLFSTYPDDNRTRVKYMKAEVEHLIKLKHTNLIPLAGYSADGPELCLVFEYMVNGSLCSQLHKPAQDGSPVLSVTQRYNILIGAASGIEYMHSLEDRPLIHGDIKSTNILLDQHFEAKVCDLGQAQMATGGSEYGEYTNVTDKDIRNYFCTSDAYLPPEFINDCQISVKGDTYSFGIVILECCTGENTNDEKREGGNQLKSYVENSCGKADLSRSSSYNQNIDSLHQLLCDKRLEHVWCPRQWYELFLIARDCTAEKKKHRPYMKDVSRRLLELLKMQAQPSFKMQAQPSFKIQEQQSYIMQEQPRNQVSSSSDHVMLSVAPVSTEVIQQNTCSEQQGFNQKTTNQNYIVAAPDIPVTEATMTRPPDEATSQKIENISEDLGVMKKNFPSFLPSLNYSSDSIDSTNDCTGNGDGGFGGVTTMSLPELVPKGSHVNSIIRECDAGDLYKTVSLDTDAVRNCDKYRLFNPLKSGGKCHSDPGIIGQYKVSQKMERSTLSGPQTLSLPIDSPPIYCTLSHICAKKSLQTFT